MKPLSSARPEPQQAIEFFKVWFGAVPEDSLISIVRIHPGNPKVRSLVLPLNDVLEALEASGLDDLIWDDETFFDLYFGVSTLVTTPPEGKRGGLKDVSDVPGVWIDIDVKGGSFTDEAEALALLKSLPLEPTAVVSTGLGGLHGYWRFRHPVKCDEGKELALKWWALVDAQAGEKSVDRLCDPSRVLRIPGALRWPKVNDPGAPVVTRSELIECSGVSYHKSQISDASDEAWKVHEMKHKEIQERTSASARLSEETLKSLNLNNPYLRAVTLAKLEEKFNETYSWDSLLLPLGWTKLREDDEGRIFWSRPGDGVRKSATTDWPESPNVMSLFSTAPETGLRDLHDSGVLLTKYRVWIELYWHGDDQGALQALIDQGFLDR